VLAVGLAAAGSWNKGDQTLGIIDPALGRQLCVMIDAGPMVDVLAWAAPTAVR
jgi:hypothetical protein